MSGTPPAHQGQLVLINLGVEPGASNRPPVTAEASSHADNPLTTSPQRPTTATAAAATAATASANPPPAGLGNTGAGSSATNNSVNPTRTSSARDRNRRTHPRTVPSARPNRPAIRRYPQPSADNTNPEPITST